MQNSLLSEGGSSIFVSPSGYSEVSWCGKFIPWCFGYNLNSLIQYSMSLE